MDVRKNVFKRRKVLDRNTRSSRPEVFCKKVFLEISQNSQENTCASVSFLIKLQVYLKRGSGTGVFLWILWNLYLWWLLLCVAYTLCGDSLLEIQSFSFCGPIWSCLFLWRQGSGMSGFWVGMTQRRPVWHFRLARWFVPNVYSYPL